MGIDYLKIAREQEKLPHANPCVCTQGPHGVILDYDCGSELERQGIVWERKDG